MRQATVQGVGINDANYPVGQGKCPYYSVWLSMMNRCYSPKAKPQYQGCSVHPDWHTFSVFKAWMEKQVWKGRSLDKDLLVPGNRVYGPDTCLFISQQANTILNPRKAGALAPGVFRHGERFKANMKKNKKTIHLGVFDTAEEAEQAYLKAKAEWVKDLALNEPDSLAQAVLLRHAAQLKGSC